MKDVTITVAKSDKGYRVIVVDDAKTEDNSNEWKSNTSELNPPSKDQMISDINEILNGIE
jgi:hypothetical protein